jgi:hypothetical protein
MPRKLPSLAIASALACFSGAESNEWSTLANLAAVVKPAAAKPARSRAVKRKTEP